MQNNDLKLQEECEGFPENLNKLQEMLIILNC